MVMPRIAGALVLCAVPALAQEINNLQHTEGTVTCELGDLGVVKAGSGDTTLILLAGAPFGAELWSSFMDANADRYTMYAVTPAGYDDTPPPPMPEDVTRAETRDWTGALFGAIDGLIERESIEEFIVVGHHLMSDYYAMHVASEHPEEAKGVVLVSPRLQMIAFAGSYTPEQRVQFVNGQRIPFFKSVTPEVWEQNTFQVDTFSTDTERAQTWFDTQLDVPIATQIRYYVEYFTSDEPELPAALAAPVHIIPAPGNAAMTPEMATQSSVQMLVNQGLSEEDARAQVDQAIIAQYGSIEAFAESLDKQSRPWEMVEWKGGVTVHEIDDTGTLVMLDQTARLTDVIAKVVKTVAAPQ